MLVLTLIAVKKSNISISQGSWNNNNPKAKQLIFPLKTAKKVTLRIHFIFNWALKYQGLINKVFLQAIQNEKSTCVICIIFYMKLQQLKNDFFGKNFVLRFLGQKVPKMSFFKFCEKSDGWDFLIFWHEVTAA